MAKVLILVEGQTEEAFVVNLLEPHLRTAGVSAIPRVLMTKRRKDGTQFKGGVGSYDQVKSDLQRLLKDSSATMVTTMLDFYGVPKDFPGLDTCPKGTDPYVKVRHLEEHFGQDIDDGRFVPYFSLHEYEAIVFSGLPQCESLFDDRSALKQLQAIRSRYETPEHINDGQATAPSKRITQAFPLYEKVIHGTLAADAIGLNTIRETCRHFGQWLSRLERAGQAAQTRGSRR